MGTLVKAAQAFLSSHFVPVTIEQLRATDDGMKSQRAREFMAVAEFARPSALPQLNQAVPNNPGSVEPRNALHMRDERNSVPQLEAAVKLDPKLAPAWLFLGAARIQLSRVPAAVEALKMALSLQPDHRGALEMLAGALLSLDRAAEAADQYRKLADLDPESSPAWFGLGRSYESLSVRTFDKLQKTAPESVYWLALVGEARLREQQFSSAFYLYRQALVKMPTMRSLHAAIAEIYRKTGHPDWANVEEEKERQLPQPDCRTQTFECEFRAEKYSALVVAAQDGNTPEAHYWRSRAYNELALQAFTRLGQLPPSREHHELKAHIYSGQKRYVEAADEWKEARKFSPSDPQIQKQLAISLKFSRDYAGALPLFQVSLSAADQRNWVHLVGDTLLDLQRAEEAIPLPKRAVDHDPKLLAAHKSLARADLAAGNAAEAIPHLKVALATDEDGSLHYQLARAYQTNGQPGLAEQVLADYQKLQRSAAAAREVSKQEVEITPP
jgi:tetratricopeptide (TPR) repeat protein